MNHLMIDIVNSTISCIDYTCASLCVCVCRFIGKLLDGLDVLMENDLGPLKQQFVAQSIIGGYRNLTADQFRRSEQNANTELLFCALVEQDNT